MRNAYRFSRGLVFATVLTVVAGGGGTATAFHNSNSSCSFSDGIVRLRLADEHVVRLLVEDGHIVYADLTDSSRGGRCGNARVRNTDRIVVTEADPGGSRLQFDQQLGRFGPGRIAEDRGRSEIEVRLNTLADLWLMGRPGADRVTVGERGVNLNDDRDVDLIGTELKDVNVFLLDGDDRLSGMGGRGSGAAYRSPRGGLFVTGGDGNDVIEGSPYADYLDGEFANDRVSGRGGRDEVFGGTHDDSVYGNRGDDVVGGDGGADRIAGGRHDDILLSNDNVAESPTGGRGTDRAFIDTLDSPAGVEHSTYGDP